MKTFILVVQGEGRGHLMQAITVYELLVKAGHDICCVVVGRSDRLSIPDFFSQRIKAPVICLHSPGFIKSAGRTINLWRTFMHVLLNFSEYISSIQRLHRLICYHKPDTLINFYEPLAGIHGLLFPGLLKRISIAHQYVYLHEEYSFAETNIWSRMLLRSFTRLTAIGSDKLLALSISEMAPANDHRLQVVPPILRKEVFSQNISDKGFILIYLVYSGYMRDVIDWHEKNPGIHIHCFTDDVAVLHKHHRLYKYDDRLWFHSINDQLFLEMLASCNCVVTSAGFETVCEALVFGKPLLMVPVEGHQEQKLNALDAERAGLATRADAYHIDKVLNKPAISKQFQSTFKSRVSDMHEILLEALEVKLPYMNTAFISAPTIPDAQTLSAQM